ALRVVELLQRRAAQVVRPRVGGRLLRSVPEVVERALGVAVLQLARAGVDQRVVRQRRRGGGRHQEEQQQGRLPVHGGYGMTEASMAVMEAMVIAGFMPTAIVGIVAYFRYKTKQLTAGRGVAEKELEALRAERRQLEARVQNLESIVCSVDLELNARL